MLFSDLIRILVEKVLKKIRGGGPTPGQTFDPETD